MTIPSAEFDSNILKHRNSDIHTAPYEPSLRGAKGANRAQKVLNYLIPLKVMNKNNILGCQGVV